MIDINEVLYHGTTRRYHDMQVEKHGLYRHDEGELWLTNNLIVAAGIYATRRGRIYDSASVLLIASKPVVEARAKRIVKLSFPDRVEVSVNYLSPEEYMLLPLIKKDKSPNYFSTREGRTELEEFMREHSFGEQI